MLRLTKLDAAERHLSTAIRLFFHGGDAVSAHTLGFAAHEVLRRLMEHRGLGESMVKNSKLVPPAQMPRFCAILNSPANFFKHAERDPAAVLDFNPEDTVIWLLDAAWMHWRLANEFSSASEVLFIWFLAEDARQVAPEHFPDVFRKHNAIVCRLRELPTASERKQASLCLLRAADGAR